MAPNISNRLGYISGIVRWEQHTLSKITNRLWQAHQQVAVVLVQVAVLGIHDLPAVKSVSVIFHEPKLIFLKAWAILNTGTLGCCTDLMTWNTVLARGPFLLCPASLLDSQATYSWHPLVCKGLLWSQVFTALINLKRSIWEFWETVSCLCWRAHLIDLVFMEGLGEQVKLVGKAWKWWFV